jgi:hypothetical protein
MIHDSRYWKEPLLLTANWLRSLKTAIDLAEEDMARLEREVFVGFYAIRKLFEAPTKITDATKAAQVKLKWHPNRQQVNWRNVEAVDENYDLSVSHEETREIYFLCGRIIHSYVFMPCFEVSEEQNVAVICSLMFASDTDKDKKLYVLHIDAVIDIFERV